MRIHASKPLFAWDCLEDGPTLRPIRDVLQPFPTPGSSGPSARHEVADGTIYCYDKGSDPPVRRQMAYIGHEASRGTWKYRCPVFHGNRNERCASDGRATAPRC